MPLNRKNRITAKKMNSVSTTPRTLNRRLYTLYKNGLVSSKTLLDNEQFPEGIIVLTDGEAVNKNNSGAGCTCKKCGNYNEYAEANQDDGSFVCFSCKNDY